MFYDFSMTLESSRLVSPRVEMREAPWMKLRLVYLPPKSSKTSCGENFQPEETPVVAEELFLPAASTCGNAITRLSSAASFKYLDTNVKEKTLRD